jgi:two-component system, OmpR family, response regulator
MPFPKILIVDDDEDLTQLLRLCLQNAWEVHTAHGREEAVSVLGRVTPDLIMLDLHLGGLLGTDLYRDLRAAGLIQATPTVFLTAAGAQSLEDEIIGLGAAGVLRKPIQPFSLAGDLAKYLPSQA